MRGEQERQITLLLGVVADDLVPADHPIRRIPGIVDRAWQQQAGLLRGDLHTQNTVVDRLCQRYFAGHPLLFAAEAERLTGLQSVLAKLIDLYNRALAA